MQCTLTPLFPLNTECPSSGVGSHLDAQSESQQDNGMCLRLIDHITVQLWMYGDNAIEVFILILKLQNYAL